MNRKASIQLSINFLVVLIICIVLMGIGIKLIADLVDKGKQIEENVNKYHEERLRRILDQGAQVATYPDTKTVNRGDEPIFTLGISNELGFQTSFFVLVEKDAYTVPTGGQPELLYLQNIGFPLKNNEQKFTSIKIIIPNDADTGSHIFNAYVCNGTACSSTSKYRYGQLQKIYVNVR